MNKNSILVLIEKLFGRSNRLRNEEYAFYCTFCNHHKKKLQVNLKTQKWHCWICNTGGHNLIQLFKKLKATKEQFQELYDSGYSKTTKFVSEEDTAKEVVKLPSQYIPLWEKQNTPEYKRAMLYLQNRGITIFDILKYSIGYCESGLYSNRIIIPSYDENAQLNYFVGRSFYETTMKYKNPFVSKDVIGFDLFINWSEPIILCEGVFDAITIKRNAIPLFGKTIPKKLERKIIEKNVQDIYIALDTDAIKDSLKICEKFMNQGRNVYMVDLPNNTDPSDLGFEKIHNFLENTNLLNFSSLIKYRLLG